MAEPAHVASLGVRTTRGLVWLVGQTAGAKTINLIGQVVLAILLRPEDFGLYGLAIMVGNFTSLVQQIGLREILVQRQNRMRQWANPAFWMALALAFATSALTILATPFAAHSFGSRTVAEMLLITALVPPLSSLATVTSALAQTHLRFRLQATVDFAATALSLLLTIGLALLGFGAFSFVIPMPLVALFRSAAYWVAVGKDCRGLVRLDPQFRRWRYLWGDGGRQLGFALCATITLQGDYLLLGLLRSKAEVGIYYFGFNLSMQTVQLVGMNLAGVLFPALALIRSDSKRQTNAFLSAVRLMAFLAVPLCFAQAALAAVGMRLLFSEKWDAAIPVVQVLSLGMAFLLFGWQAGALLQAQRRLGVLLRYGIFSVFLFLGLVYLGARLGGPVAVAAAVSVSFCVLAFTALGAALWADRHHWLRLGQSISLPFVLSAVVFGPLALLNVLFVPHGKATELLTLVGEGVVSLTAYCSLIVAFAPATFQELKARILSAWNR
jgi:PST family polysaccharide transporter